MSIYLETPVCPFWSLISVQGLYYPNFSQTLKKNLELCISASSGATSSKIYDHFQASGPLGPKYFLDFPTQFYIGKGSKVVIRQHFLQVNHRPCGNPQTQSVQKPMEPTTRAMRANRVMRSDTRAAADPT